MTADPPPACGGIVIGGDDSYASSNNIVENNVIANASDYNVTNYWESRVGTGNIVRNNCVWNGQKGNIRTPNGYTATNNTIANPQFANPTTRNYTIPNTNRCAKLIRVRTAGVQGAGAKRARHVRVRFRLRKYRSSRVFNRFRRLRAVASGAWRQPSQRTLLVGRARQQGLREPARQASDRGQANPDSQAALGSRGYLCAPAHRDGRRRPTREQSGTCPLPQVKTARLAGVMVRRALTER